MQSATKRKTTEPRLRVVLTNDPRVAEESEKLKIIFDQPLLTPEATARRLGVTVGTLAVVRCNKRWPLPYIKVGRKVMYDARAVASFEASRTKDR